MPGLTETRDLAFENIEVLKTSTDNQNKLSDSFSIETASENQKEYEEPNFFDKSNNPTLSELEEDSIVETTALKDSSDSIITTENCVTVPGTIKRGKKKAQNVEVVLNISREELEVLEKKTINRSCFSCNIKKGVGIHVLLWTILTFPFSILISGIYSFYMGTITWYNVFVMFSENKSVGLKISFPPLLIVLYPLIILLLSLGLGLHAGIKQLSCCWDTWWKEFRDYEKGFYGWLCNNLDIPECSPYEVVVLTSVQKD